MGGVLLAAGLSRRFGGLLPKQLFEIEGRPIVRRVAQEALSAALDELVVVVGHRGDDVRTALEGLAARVVENPDYAAGQGSSVRAGIAAVADSMDAALFMPCDQPFLDRDVIDRIVRSYRSQPTAIVVPTFGGRRGSPVLFSRRLFGELATVGGDRGGRQLFAEHARGLRTVELPSGRPLADFDTRAELATLLALPNQAVH